jgi:hypothetical protein
VEDRAAAFPLLASKSSLGHSEPASGIMGLAHLQQACLSCLAPPDKPLAARRSTI